MRTTKILKGGKVVEVEIGLARHLVQVGSATPYVEPAAAPEPASSDAPPGVDEAPPAEAQEAPKPTPGRRDAGPRPARS